MVAPPFVITEAEIDEVVSLLRRAILEVWEGVSALSGERARHF
jgi:adenosylmethionine-8-amino-7-oxononanoate aminotransferase